MKFYLRSSIDEELRLQSYIIIPIIFPSHFNVVYSLKKWLSLYVLLALIFRDLSNYQLIERKFFFSLYISDMKRPEGISIEHRKHGNVQAIERLDQAPN